MSKVALLGTLLTFGLAASASAAPVVGSFSATSFGGTYLTASGLATAATATELDFGSVFGSSGNGFGTNGSALLGNTTGSFAGMNGQQISIADILISGTTANPYQSNPFISFLGGSGITVSFSNAVVSRSSTSITVTGAATFADGTPADTTVGNFSLSTDSQSSNGANASSANFTFTTNAGSTAVPEPASMALLGMGLLGLGVVRQRARR